MRIHLFILWAGTACLAAQTTAPVSCPGSTVGFRVMTFGGRNVGVWYPSSSAEAAYSYSARISGSVALNGAPAVCQGLPLVVFSHGYTGCGTQSAFITEQLARSGYVVAAPDHADAGCSAASSGRAEPPPPQQPFGDPSNWTEQTYLDRRADIVSTIDGILSSPDFGRMIDANRIGGMGHSLGGYTIMGMIGGWSGWLDARLKAALLLSPYVQPFLRHNSIAGIRVPVQYQGGTRDFGITPSVAKPGGAYDQTASPKYLAVLKNAGHLAWSNAPCIRAGTVAQCLSTVSSAATIDLYGFAFFDHYLRNQVSPLLRGTGAGLADYRYDVPRR